MDRPTQMLWSVGEEYKIALFYRYVSIDNVAELVTQLRKCCEDHGILGRVLVSPEGLNGTLAGSIPAVDLFVDALSRDPRFGRIDWKFTLDKGDQLPFLGLSIREVDEIISSGPAKAFIEENIKFDSNTYGGIVGTGTHLTPSEFHAAIARQDGVILDVRNEFEYDIGHFEGSTNLKTFNYAETFDALDGIVGEAPTVAPQQVEETPVQQQNIYMYCTGGIRCEKASAYLCAKGFTNVYQLEGGIHRYLEAFPDGGLFQGKNFVFDSRVSVGPAVCTPTTDGDAAGEHCSVEQKCSTDGVITSVKDECSTGKRKRGVVGKCIDCSAPHDVYAGSIVCTVCRMPVLVCPSCVASNPVQGEYHCCRHRDLKELYFTVLTQFSLAQLQAQLTGLQALLTASISHKAALMEEERRNRRVAARLAHTPRPAAECSADLDKNSVQPSPIVASTALKDGAAENMGKQRRRTIRKQIERLQVLIRKLSAQQKLEQDRGSAGTALVGEIDYVGDYDAGSVDISCNPKTRGGLGFWKT